MFQIKAQFPGEQDKQARTNHLNVSNLTLCLNITSFVGGKKLILSKVHLPKFQHIQTEHKSKQYAY